MLVGDKGFVNSKSFFFKLINPIIETTCEV